MTNVYNLEIFPFIKFTWEPHHQLAFVAIVRLSNQCLLFATKLVSVYDVIDFCEKNGFEFLVVPSFNKLLFKN